MNIAIDLGHGTDKDKGECGIIDEEEVINSIGYYLLKKLKNKHEIIEVRPNKKESLGKTGSLKYRVNESNEHEVELYLSIHTSKGGGTGTEIYTYNGKEIDYGLQILSNLGKLGFRNRGIKNGTGFYVIKNTKAKAIVINLFFIDTLFDVNKYYEVGAENIANGIANALEENNIEEFNYDDISRNKEKTTNMDNEEWWTKLRNEIIIQGYGYFDNLELINKIEVLSKAPIVQYGARGSITKIIQEILSINNDGVFGNETRNVVVDFQKEKNINIDGIVGYNTWKCLIDSYIDYKNK